MKNIFIDKLKSFISYCDRFDRITLFEITQYFGPSLFLVFIALLSLPLFFFSAQWLVIPLTTLCLLFAIWYFFDTKVWIPDVIKAKTLPSSTTKEITRSALSAYEKWRTLAGKEDRFASLWIIFGPLNVVLIAIAAFVIGFASSVSLLPVFSLLLLPLGLLWEDVYLSLAGYFCLVVEALRVWG